MMVRIAQMSMAGLTSQLGGFTNYAHRYAVSKVILGKIGEERLILAEPTYIQSTHQTIWEIAHDMPLQSLQDMPLMEQHQYRERFERAKSEILQQVEISEGHDTMKELHKALVIPNLSSVYVVRSAETPEARFVLINWGCLENGKDAPPPPRALKHVGIKVICVRKGLPLSGRRILVAIGESGSEEVPYISDDRGEVALGKKEMGARIFVRQESSHESFRQQEFIVGSVDPFYLNFQWSQSAFLELLLPPFERRSPLLQEVLWVLDEKRSKIALSSGSSVAVEGFYAGDEVKVLSMSQGETFLWQGICAEGRNVVDLRDFKLDEVAEDESEPITLPDPPSPAESGGIRILWCNFLNRPIAGLKFGLNTSAGQREINHETDELGRKEVRDLAYGEYHLFTHRKNQDWLFPIQHERGIEEHELRLRRHWPWWIFMLGAAILLMTGLMFWRVAYRPEIRVVDASTWTAIPGAQVEYQNFDGQTVIASANEAGLVQLNMGERPLYEKVFQINPELPAVARAEGYQENPSLLHYRTWYWTQDWPLAPSEVEDELGSTPTEGIELNVDDVLSTGDRPWEDCRPRRTYCSGGDCIRVEVCSVEPIIVLIQKGAELVSHFAVLNGEVHTENLASGSYRMSVLSGVGWNYGSIPPVPIESGGCVLRGYFNDDVEVYKLDDIIENSFGYCQGCGNCKDPVSNTRVDIQEILR